MLLLLLLLRFLPLICAYKANQTFPYSRMLFFSIRKLINEYTEIDRFLFCVGRMKSLTSSREIMIANARSRALSEHISMETDV